MFQNSKFNKDLSDWKPYLAKNISALFSSCSAPTAYWAEIEDLHERAKAINSYQEKKNLIA
jgi:hypothetical protein